MILFILTIGLVLRSISLNQSLWLDEAINVLATTQYSFLGMITEYAKADFHPPLFFIILWPWIKLFGSSEIAVRIPSIIFGLLAIYIVYLIGKKIYSERLGLISGFLLAINPLHIYYSQEARMYSLATLAVVINILLLIKLVKGEKLNLIFLVCSNLLVLMSDYVACLIFPAQFAFLLFLKSRIFIKKWFIAFIIAIIMSLWWLPTFLSQLNVGSIASSRLPSWKLIVGDFDLKTVPLTFVKFIIGKISYSDKIVYGIILLPISTLFLFLIYRGFKSIKEKGMSLLIYWLVIPIMLATLISLFIPIYSYFRVLFVIPAFIILVALGIVSFRFKIGKAFLIAVVTIEVFSSGIYLLNPLYQREDWRGLVSFLKSKEDNLILFESSGSLAPFDYYAKNSLNAKGALKDFPARNENDVIALQNQDVKDIYLIDYLVDISDPTRLVDKKLTNLNYKIIETNDFHGVGFVYHYQKTL